MFAGHVGAALALGRAERRVNVGVFVGAAVLLDAVLWVLVLLGPESVVLPPDYASTHQPAFVFPWSHSLAGALAWSAIAGVLAWLACARLGAARSRAAALVAAAVFSHWLLDALVHRPELPLAGAGSDVVGLALWNRMPLALVVEAAIAIGGLALFVRGGGLARARRWTLIVLVLVVLVLTVVGMTVAPPPPSIAAMAVTSLATLAAVVGVAAWAGRRLEAE